MIRSMTGYGRGEQVLHDRTITVELRAVNNRYLDCSVKLPRLYVFAEEAIKAQVQKSVGRGKVDVFLTIDSAAADKVSVTLNKPVADGYYTALTQMRDAYGLRDDISVSLLSRFPDVFLVEKEQGDAEEIVADISQVLAQALEEFNAMRTREGEKLAQDIRGKAEKIAQLVAQVEARSPESVNEYREKLRQRMQEVLENTQLDETRILTEAAIFADKVAVDEETVRLHSHLDRGTASFSRQSGAAGCGRAGGQDRARRRLRRGLSRRAAEDRRADDPADAARFAGKAHELAGGGAAGAWRGGGDRHRAGGGVRRAAPRAV